MDRPHAELGLTRFLGNANCPDRAKGSARRGRSFGNRAALGGIGAGASCRFVRRGCSFDLGSVDGLQIEGTTAPSIASLGWHLKTEGTTAPSNFTAVDCRRYHHAQWTAIHMDVQPSGRAEATTRHNCRISSDAGDHRSKRVQRSGRLRRSCSSGAPKIVEFRRAQVFQRIADAGYQRKPDDGTQ